MILRNTFITLFLGWMGLLFPSDPNGALAQEIQSIQPEDFTQHRRETEIVPAKTIFIKVKDPEEAAEMISESHIAQARQGWRVFNVTAYQKNEDFRGFFVTYVKVGESE
ncbi:MAG: hypothetical protein QNI91_18875 [Arenicellales bacterium]|nr:hypothetical protein [Arenicellales bacterium]